MVCYEVVLKTMHWYLTWPAVGCVGPATLPRVGCNLDTNLEKFGGPGTVLNEGKENSYP
jgi:hypothetical protein